MIQESGPLRKSTLLPAPSLCFGSIPPGSSLVLKKVEVRLKKPSVLQYISD